MKRPTHKRREWNTKHAHGLLRRKLVRKRYLKAKRQTQSGRRTETPRIGEGRPAISIKCPSTMSIAENFEGVIKLLDQIRRQSNRRRNEKVYIDFREIKEISASAALVLAAELDRWNHTQNQRGRKLRAVDMDEWDEHVRNRLEDIGFFDLLDVQVSKRSQDAPSNIKYIRFRSGTQAEGKAVEDLRALDLMPFFGDNIPKRHRLYAAVTEAMTNVVQHAYENRTQTIRPNWWLSASHNVDAGEIRILLYDQGIGIPKTLPKKFQERLRQILPNPLKPTDAEMIQAAHNLTRSASGEKHRGNGLQRDVRRYVESVNCMSSYRVTSLHGQYSWERKPDGQPQQSIHNFRQALPGTLIEWRLNLQ